VSSGALCVADPDDDAIEPDRDGAAAARDPGEGEHDQCCRAGEQRGERGASEVVGARGAGQEQQPRDDHGGAVDGARQEEQAAGAPHDPACRGAGEMDQPAADRVAADAATRKQRAGGHLGPRQRARVARADPVEEQAEDDHEAGARRQLERDRDRDP
jgi:hypothetical protein